ncbi:MULTISPECIES: hypothetical protein [Pantoea]|uniref:hypothetical protein n=1 Tax=Pantoea TaxID=53335 RepID=UPI000CF4DD6E|nr:MULTISPECIES: hypothetical protein [Pantoea]PQK87718.1 hypothetical protein CG432_15245 [Pantoea ananatis]
MAGKPENSIFQTHSGQGNNIGGHSFDLRGSHFNAGLMPENLVGAMHMILDDIAGFRLEDARKRLASLERVNFGVQDSDDLIAVLDNLCNVIDGRYDNIDSQKLRRIANEATSNDLADLALSVQLRLQVRRNDVPGATERYCSAPRSGKHSRAIYYECLCGEEEELLKVFAAKKYALTRPELTGLATGLLRFSNGRQAEEVARFIQSEYVGDYNGAVLSILAQATQINACISARCYWLLSQSDKDAVVKLIHDTLTLSEMTDGRDRRLYNILLPAFDYVQANIPALEKFCLEHIEMIDGLSAEFASRLRSFSEAETSENFDASGQMGNLVLLKDNDQIAEEDFFLLVRSGYINEIRDWTRRGGRVQRDQGTLTDAVFCLIECLFTVQKSAETLKKTLDALICRQDFSDLNPHFMQVLAKEMLLLKRPFEAASLLEKVVGDTTEVWCSPLMETLCEALYKANQHIKLERIAGIINHPDRTQLFFRLNIDSCLRHRNLEKALTLIKEGLILYPESISLQFSHLVFLNLSGNSEALSEAISELDLTFLEVPSEQNFGAMHFLREHGRREDVQDILVKWFVSAPDKHARLVSQFCLNTLTGNSHPPPQIAFASGNCQCGVVCEVNGEVMTRIICSPNAARHSVLLSEDTPLARELLKMQPGDEARMPMRKIRLLEKIPVYVAVFRLSAELRNLAFDGDDVFCSLTISDATEDILGFLQEHLPPPHFDYDLLGNSNLPLSMRAYRNQASDPVGACLQALTDRRFSKATPYDTGLKGSDSLFTDLITLVYLAATSLTHYFVQKSITLYVSPYTLELVDEWIDSVEKGEYRKLGVTEDRRIGILNAETVMNDRSGIYQNLKNVRSVVTAIKPKPGDLPWVFCLLSDVLHPVSFGEYYAVSAGVSPYFTIDSVSAGYVRVACGDVVCNARQLLIEAAKSLSYAERESGIALHIVSALPLPLVLSDVENLASSHRLAGPEWLCNFLGMLTTAFPPDVNIYEFLVGVYMRYVQNIARQGVYISVSDPFLTAESHPYGVGLDRVMYACCDYLLRVPAACSAEDKLITLACTFISQSGDSDIFISKLWPYMQRFMQGRFMSSVVVVNGINCIMREVRRRLNESK